MNKLEEAREGINRIDREIASLFEKRMTYVEDVIEYKIENKMPIFDEGREVQVIEQNSKLIKNEKYLPYYRKFIEDIMKISKEYQRDMVKKKEAK